MLKNEVILADGTRLSSGVGTVNAIQSCTLTQCVNDGKELMPGSVCSACLEVKLIVPGGALSIPTGAENCVALEKNGTQAGVFVPEKPVRTGANSYTLTAYDKVSLLDKELSQWLAGLDGWPYTLYKFAGMVCDACGLTLANTQIPNGEFPVRQFARAQVTGRQLMRWIGQIACRFCRADRKGNILFDWYQESNLVIRPAGERFYYAGALQYEDYAVAQIDGVKLRPVGTDAGVLWPEGETENPYIITSNPILTAQVDDSLKTYLEVIHQELVRLGEYRPCTVTVPAGMDIHAGNVIEVEDSYGVRFRTLVMTKIQAGQRDTLKCTGSFSRSSTTAVNDQSVAQIVQGALDSQTQQDIFNKLTNGGQIQGIYIQDGKWYINAELAKIVNLIADRVLSVKNDYSLAIDGACLRMTYDSVESAALRNYGDSPVLYLHGIEDGEWTNSSELSPWHLKLGGTSTEPTLEISTRGGKPQMWLNGETFGKYLSWKDNGDGTYTLIGT